MVTYWGGVEGVNILYFLTFEGQALNKDSSIITIYLFENTLVPIILLMDDFIPSTNSSSALLSGTGTAHPFNEDGFVFYAEVPEHDISPFGAHSQGAGVSWVPCQGCGPPVKGGSLLEYPVRSQRAQKGLLETLTQRENN